MTYPHHPRFGSNYRGLTNRLDLLLECYSYLSFPERVRTTYATRARGAALRRGASRRRDAGRRRRASAPRDRIAVRYTARRVRRADRDPDAHAAHARRRAVDRARALLRATSSARRSSSGPPAYVVPSGGRRAPRAARARGRAGAGAASTSRSRRSRASATEGGRKILEAAQVGELTVDVAPRGPRQARPARARAHRPAARRDRGVPVRARERRRRDRERPRRGARRAATTFRSGACARNDR